MSLTEFFWLLLIFAGIAVCLWMLWAESISAYYEWRYEREGDE